MAVLLDEGFAAGQVVAEEQVEGFEHVFGLVRHDLDQASGFRVHGRQPHHFRFVLTQAFRALDAAAVCSQPGQQFAFFPLRIGEKGLLLPLHPLGDFKQGRFGNEDFLLFQQGRCQAVKHGQDQGPDLEAVHIGIGTDDDFVPAQTVEVE